MEPVELARANELAIAVHGYSRNGAVRDALGTLRPFVAERGGDLVAYVTTASFYPASHGVARTDEDLLGLLLGAAAQIDEPLDLLVPIRQVQVYRRMLSWGLRTIKPITLMALGDYREPRGAWLPSILY